MSVCYFIVDHKHRRYLPIGKYPGALREPDLVNSRFPLDMFTELALELARSRNGELHPDDEKHLRERLPEVHAFCANADWDVDVLSDSGDDFFSLVDDGYSELGQELDPRDRTWDHMQVEKFARKGLITLEERAMLSEALTMLVRAEAERVVASLRERRSRITCPDCGGDGCSATHRGGCPRCERRGWIKKENGSSS